MGLLQNFLQLRQVIFFLHRAVLTLHIIVDHTALERTRPEQRQQGDDIFKTVRFHLLEQIAHTGTFQLKHSARTGIAEKREGFCIIFWNRIDIQLRSHRGLNEIESIVNNRQSTQAEEIHLQQAQLFDIVHRKLSDNFVVASFIKRQEFGERLGRNHHARCMSRTVTWQAFQLERDSQQLVDAGTFLTHLLELGLFLERISKIDVQPIGYQFGNFVDFAVSHSQHPAYVADNPFCVHTSESDDLTDEGVASILFRNIFDNIVPPVHTEIDIDIGHAHPFRIQKPLEQQIVLHGIDVGDFQ